MKPQEWNDGLNHLDQDLVEEYIAIKDKKRKPIRPFWMATVAAALVVTIGLGMLASSGILPTNGPNLETLPVTEPSAPTTEAPTTPPVPVAPTSPIVTVPPAVAPTSPIVTVPPTVAPTSPIVTVPPAVAPTSPIVTVPPTVTPTRPVVTNPPTMPPQEPVIVPLKNLVYAPVYPEMLKYPNVRDYITNTSGFYIAVDTWEKERKQQYLQPDGYADSLTDYFHKSINQFLRGEGNQVYSPLNVYLAMAMVAETTGGNSRQQILDLLGLDTIEQLREQVNHLWNAHYCADGVTDTLLANSMWLDDSYTFNRETLKLLADRYYAASFSGNLGTDGMNKQLQSWLNENTGGMLTEQANNIKMDGETAFALASTVYFTASWEQKFQAMNTQNAIFHSATADKKVPFMNKSMLKYLYYWGENFGAVRLDLTGDNCMWLILPDEGHTTADVLASDEYLQMTLDPDAWERKKTYEINLSLPKFDVSEQQDLKRGMMALGLTDIFNVKTSDFSPITTDSSLCVNQINHAVRVTVDEEGCKGAAFTVVIKPGMAMPPKGDKIDFVLDRPFVFVVSSQDNLPLFAGIVNEP